MNTRNWAVAAGVLCAVLASGAAAPAYAAGVRGEAAEAQLIVQVAAAKPLYQVGERVSLEVQTFFNGEPVDAQLTAARLSVTLPNGQVRWQDIREDLVQVSPGVYRSSGWAALPGRRDLEVHARVKAGCNCNAIWVKGQGAASYAVATPELTVAAAADDPAPSVCDTLDLHVRLSQDALVQVLIVYPHAVQRNLVVPGWLPAGAHTLTLPLREFFDVGAVTVRVVARDGYGQQVQADVALDVRYGVCDC